MPTLLSPYDVERQLERELAAVTDAQERTILAAWVLAWSEISADLHDTLLDLLAGGTRITAATVVRSERLASTLAAVADTIDDLAQQAGVTITSDLSAVLDQAIDGTGLLIRAQMENARRFNSRRRPSRSALDAIVERVTEQITSTLLPIADETYATIQRELIRGVAVGDSPRETARRMVQRSEDLWNFGASRALNVARTETLDAYRDGAKAAEEPHADILAGWTWLAHLGPKTCRSCLAMHGQLFPLDKAGPEDHQQGRCSRCPVVRGADGEPDLSWVPSAEEHFKSLTKDEQVAILGREGYAAWAAGDFPIDQWTKTKSSDGWRDSQVPASPGDAGAGGGRGSGGGAGPGDPEPRSIREAMNVLHEDAQDVANRVAALINEVHLVPGNMTTIDVGFLTARRQAEAGTGLKGQYFHFPGTAPQLQMRQPISRVGEFVMIHELGHALDDLIFGDGISSISTGTKTNLDGELADFMDAVRSTQAFQWLEEMAEWDPTLADWARVRMPAGQIGVFTPDHDYVEYLLRPAEIFGRAYSQWIATMTDDEDLRFVLSTFLGMAPVGFTVIGDRPATHPLQWEDDDFEVIAAALRRLFESRGLLKEGL